MNSISYLLECTLDVKDLMGALKTRKLLDNVDKVFQHLRMTLELFFMFLLQIVLARTTLEKELKVFTTN